MRVERSVQVMRGKSLRCGAPPPLRSGGSPLQPGGRTNGRIPTITQKRYRRREKRCFRLYLYHSILYPVTFYVYIHVQIQRDLPY
ncbi:hypothetical protein QTP88_012947 [Uroleucon formosanum]